MDIEIDVDYIEHKIQQVLNNAHVNPRKQMIDNHQHDRLRFACPICGDSSKKMDEKRGYLFFNNLYYKCYNEDCRSTFTGLCKRFGVDVDIKEREKIKKFISVQLSLYNKKREQTLMSNFDKLIPLDDLLEWANEDVNSPYKSFGKVTFGSSVYSYLFKRGFSEQQIYDYFFQATKINSWGKPEPYVIFLNIKDNKIVGMQERNIVENKLYRRYKIWSFKQLYEAIYKDELDLEEEIGYNQLGYLFNIFNVDFERRVTIFEGYIDSLFYPNSIGSVGLNTDYSIFTKNDIDVQYFFDNDNIGIRKASEFLKMGRTVFVWEHLIIDLARKEDDPFLFRKWFNKNIKDLNDLMLHTNIRHNDLKKYFSDKEVDIMFLKYKTNKELKDEEKKKNKKTIHNFIWKL